MSKVDSVRPVVSPVSSIKHDNKCAAIPDAHRVRIGGLGSLMVGIHGRGAPIRMSSALQRTSKVKNSSAILWKIHDYSVSLQSSIADTSLKRHWPNGPDSLSVGWRYDISGTNNSISYLFRDS